MNRMPRKLALVLFLVFLVISMGSPNLSNAAGKKTTSNGEDNITAKITTVRGLIENVPDDTIVVRGKRYTITGVPLVRSSGEPATKDQLKRGKKVGIYFENNIMKSILVYDDMVQ